MQCRSVDWIHVTPRDRSQWRTLVNIFSDSIKSKESPNQLTVQYSIYRPSGKGGGVLTLYLRLHYTLLSYEYSDLTLCKHKAIKQILEVYICIVKTNSPGFQATWFLLEWNEHPTSCKEENRSSVARRWERLCGYGILGRQHYIPHDSNL